MNWLAASLVTMFLWGGYSIFADKAVEVHGEKVSFVFEIVGMLLVALVVFVSMGGGADFKKVTSASFMNALLMGIMTSAAAFFLLYALRVAPTQNHVPIIVVIAGFYPIITVILAHLFLDSKLTPLQWLGVGLAGVSLFLLNWKPAA